MNPHPWPHAQFRSSSFSSLSFKRSGKPRNRKPLLCLTRFFRRRTTNDDEGRGALVIFQRLQRALPGQCQSFTELLSQVKAPTFSHQNKLDYTLTTLTPHATWHMTQTKDKRVLCPLLILKQPRNVRSGEIALESFGASQIPPEHGSVLETVR